MKKTKKIMIFMVVLLISLLIQQKTYASDLANSISVPEYTEEYKEYLQLTEEQRKNRILPRMFEIEKTNINTKNAIKILRNVRSNSQTNFSLKDVIPDNVIVKNQGKTNSCWAFATLSSLETNLALKNKGTTPKIYDFSERHMEYATSRVFANDAINKLGYKRKVGSGGNSIIANTYLTNGMGAIDENSMPFENNEDTIELSEIQNKEVTSQVYDTVTFPSYGVNDDKTEIKEKMKEHIKNYGSISANIFGATLVSDYYNNETGAIYCNNESECPMDHAVSIIGWDDEYPIEKFNEKHRPQNKGAWIIKNSWGEKIEGYTLEGMKTEIFNQASSEIRQQYEWNSASDIDDEEAKEILSASGYTIDEEGNVSMTVGDHGLMYLSYEDINVYMNLYGIEKSSDQVDYENIYQYNELGAIYTIEMPVSKIYLGNVFNKKTSGNEYLTQVSLDVSEACTCRVYVNENGNSMAKNDLRQVKLKAGDTESFNAGYHTLEFASPIQIKGNQFAVVIEMQGTRDNKISIWTETNIPESICEEVEVEKNKCFITEENDFNVNNWVDLGNMKQVTEGNVNNVDSTIKAFTVSKVKEEDLPIQDEEKTGEDEIQNSNFESAKSNMKSVKLYTSGEYLELDIEINNITRSSNYDSYEYYYYLSPNQTEENIKDWVKITQEQKDNNKLTFTINTNDIKNMEEIADSDTLYLYIKEVATKGEKQEITISKSISLEPDSTTEFYIDGVKLDEEILKDFEVETSNTAKSDETVATKILPNTGIGSILVICVTILIIGTGMYKYIRYKNLKKYIK